LLDRLTRHVHILEMNGESYRLNQSRKRQKSEKRPYNRRDHGYPCGLAGTTGNTVPHITRSGLKILRHPGLKLLRR